MNITINIKDAAKCKVITSQDQVQDYLEKHLSKIENKFAIILKNAKVRCDIEYAREEKVYVNLVVYLIEKNHSHFVAKTSDKSLISALGKATTIIDKHATKLHNILVSKKKR